MLYIFHGFIAVAAAHPLEMKQGHVTTAEETLRLFVQGPGFRHVKNSPIKRRIQRERV